MIIDKIKGDTAKEGNFFYFAADSLYFNNYGKPLAKSLKFYAPWANVHVHLYNPNPEDLTWCCNNGISFTHEDVDTGIKELNTYYACMRFVRIPEIFTLNSRIISLDCDGVVVKPITYEKFIEDTNHSAVLWRAKQQQSLASSVLFGPDKFRYVLAEKIVEHFRNDTFKWFLDQEVMDEMIKRHEVKIIEFRDWGNPKIGKTTLIWTAKGEKKDSSEFQELIAKFK